MKKLQVGIIGLGFGITSHLPAFRKNKYCEVVALSCKNSKKGNLLKKKNKIKYFFNNWKRMLNEIELDLISIAVPPFEQTKIIYNCLKKKISIFAEKPLTINALDSKKILYIQEKSKIPCAIDFIFPEIPEWIHTKKLLQKKTFGTLRNIDIELNYQSYSNFLKKNSWKNNLNKGGGILHHIVCHIFYYIEWFFEPIESISAYLYKDKNYRFSGYTNVTILLRFKSGGYATIKASNNSLGMNEHTIKFFNDKGIVILENKTEDWVNGFNLYTFKRKSLLQKKIFFKKNNIKHNQDSRLFLVSKIVNRLIEKILFKKDMIPNFKNGHRVQQLIESALKSSQSNGKWINLK